MKRLLAVLMALGLIAAACGDDEPAEPAADTGADEAVAGPTARRGRTRSQ